MTDDTLPIPPTDLQLKRSAPVRAYRPPPRSMGRHARAQRAEVVGSARDVDRKIRQLSRAGRLARTGPRHLITRGPRAGLVAVPVVLLEQAKYPVWTRAVVAAGVGLGVAALIGGLLVWLLVSLSPEALAALCVAALVLMLARIGRSLKMGGSARSRVRVSVSVD